MSEKGKAKGRTSTAERTRGAGKACLKNPRERDPTPKQGRKAKAPKKPQRDFDSESESDEDGGVVLPSRGRRDSRGAAPRRPAKREPEEKAPLRRQNSATLRKYGSVYESLQKDQKESTKKVTGKSKDVRAEDKPAKGILKKKETREKPKRKLNPYQVFFKEQRLAGKTPSEIGALWKRQKDRD